MKWLEELYKHIVRLVLILLLSILFGCAAGIALPMFLSGLEETSFFVRLNLFLDWIVDRYPE